MAPQSSDDEDVHHELLSDFHTYERDDHGKDPLGLTFFAGSIMALLSVDNNDPPYPCSDAILDESERRVAPDQFDERYETGKYEVWAYYAYFIGNSGLTLFNFAPTAFQNLLSQAAGETGVLRFAGEYAISDVEIPAIGFGRSRIHRDRTINSIVLLSNGISFIIQIFIFLILGSLAGTFSFGCRLRMTTAKLKALDFGPWRPKILIVQSLVAIAIGFGWLGIHTPEKWMVGTIMYIIGRE